MLILQKQFDWCRIHYRVELVLVNYSQQVRGGPRKCHSWFGKRTWKTERGHYMQFLFGSRNEMKVMLTANENGRTCPGVIKAEHYTVCKEPGGQCFCAWTHKKIDISWEIIPENLLKWLEETSASKTSCQLPASSIKIRETLHNNTNAESFSVLLAWASFDMSYDNNRTIER